jgi:hypothetical protein
LTYATAGVSLAVKWLRPVRASLEAFDKGSLIVVSYITNDSVSVFATLAKIAKSSFDVRHRARLDRSSSLVSNQRNYWLKNLVLMPSS